MNRRHANELLITPVTRQSAVSSSRDLKITLIILQVSAASCLVHEALTAIVKDCGRIGKKSISAYLARPKAGTHSNSL
jgi:hypothetical protein